MSVTDTDPQTSLTLDTNVLAVGFANDGLDQAEDGQIASLTSTNNFINFCLTAPDKPITNGQQITTGSCNPAPQGILPSVDAVPACKFVSPKHMSNLQAGESMTVTLNVRNFKSGVITNNQENFLAAPQLLDADGLIVGYIGIVVEELESLHQTSPTDPNHFVFFRTLNALADANQPLSIQVNQGLPTGFYRLSSFIRTQNSAPVFLPIEIHSSINDVIYFTVIGNRTSDYREAPSNDPLLDPTTTPARPTQSVTASTPAQTTQSVSVSPDPSFSRADVAGIVIGVVSGVALLILLLFVCLCRNKIWIAKKRNMTVNPFTLLKPRNSASQTFWNRFHYRTRPLADIQPVSIPMGTPRSNLSQQQSTNAIAPVMDESNVPRILRSTSTRDYSMGRGSTPCI